ncbi:vegetative cell wall protein gp1-like [Hibiscus syriacus]|uniref:Vegetative cell wall protein gp1-like n=1 Tax=Hibiscus syriacus TaxID=106335 RepID=A0A6A3A8Y8_HIBSY|nr:vegetative cell wall protein gp1-like [Hibiscus syriacus]
MNQMISVTELESLAATLSLLKSPILPPNTHHLQSKLPLLSIPTKQIIRNESVNPPKLFTETFRHLKSASLPLTTVALPFFFDTQDALAVNGEFGILEGRSVALIHPIVMGGLFFYSLWAGYLGWQWRRVRTIQNEINELKKQVTPAAVTPEGKPVEAPPSSVELEIQKLTEERKELVKGSYRDRHFNAGSILLGFGVFESVGGGLNTWFRSGKLYPGPHLFAGAAITVLWAAAAALVPAMQKGNETARSVHIALNAVNVILFIWQIPTGIEIVLKVFEFTKWP